MKKYKIVDEQGKIVFEEEFTFEEAQCAIVDSIVGAVIGSSLTSGNGNYMDRACQYLNWKIKEVTDV